MFADQVQGLPEPEYLTQRTQRPQWATKPHQVRNQMTVQNLRDFPWGTGRCHFHRIALGHSRYRPPSPPGCPSLFVRDLRPAPSILS